MRTALVIQVAAESLIRGQIDMSFRRGIITATITAAVAVLVPGLFAHVSLARGSSAGGPPYVPARLVVGYEPPVASAAALVRTQTGLRAQAAAPTQAGVAEQLIRLPAGTSVIKAAAAVRRLAGVAYAVPDYLAHAAGSWYPDDQGRIRRPRGWERLQWNFLGSAGVNAPEAWSNLISAHRPGARGVTVAILDTGVAFERWKRFRRSPDFRGTRFVAPCDLVRGRIRHGRCTDSHALDREGHGTFVAGVVAEATNNRIGVTGLAYGARLMPVRVLNARGIGDSSTIALGIRYAVQQHARVINLSLEFYPGVTAGDIPNILAAIRYAHDHGVLVVAAAGNDGSDQLAYPARAPSVVSVGATTLDRCLAEYSDDGSGLDLVAPGGGDDATGMDDPHCHPRRHLPGVFQMTFTTPGRPRRFSLPRGWYGTSMAAPEVSAAAAMVIASGVIGSHATPDQILARLEQTAEPLGSGQPNEQYGYGLLDAGAATAPQPSSRAPSSPTRSS